MGRKLNPDEVTDYLNENKEFTKQYFLRFATPKLVESWVMSRSSRLSVPDISIVGRISRSCMDLTIPTTTGSKNSVDLPEAKSVKQITTPEVVVPVKRAPRKTVEELSNLDEKELFMELIRDIAYELDMDVISHKILVNVCVLTNCDRSSLFLTKGHKDRRYLVSHLFDVTRDSTVEEAIKPHEKAIRIPFGVGIAGSVASSGELVNIPDAYQDDRFNPQIDKNTGYCTKSILCMPVKNQDGVVIGVAQIINKRQEDQVFTASDENVFSNYLTFCGIGLTNAQLYETSIEEYNRNQTLLNLAKNIFEDTECLGTVVRRIMTQAVDIMHCERCTVYIINRDISYESDVHFSNVFDLCRDQEIQKQEKTDYWQDLAEQSTTRSVFSGFAMLVAKSGEILNIDNFTRESLATVEGNDFSIDSFQAKCMLCCPIFNNKQDVIGIAQIFNKKTAHTFDETDEIMFEGFATFCGLGIHNTQMYEKAAMLVARQKVNMEVLQYHASPGQVHLDEFLDEYGPDRLENCNLHELFSFDFDDIGMTDPDTCVMAMGMFLHGDLLSKFKIPYEKMTKFILSVKKNYRPVIYHNWRHAFNVAQTMFSVFYTGQMNTWFKDLEILVLLVACLCHDLDHRGTNNNYQLLSESPIARLYGTSTMERHHFDHCVMLLQSDGCDIFLSLGDEEYKRAMSLLEEAILSTDLALYFKKRTDFQNIVENKSANWNDIENRDVLRGMLMTACDVAAISKPWPIQQRVAELVASEFFHQGDLERTNFSKDPIPMMDREKHQELPTMQVGFIDFVCMALYKTLYHVNPHLKPLYDGVVNNRKNWQDMIENYSPREVVIAQPPKDKDRKGSNLSHRKKSRNVSFDDKHIKHTAPSIPI